MDESGGMWEQQKQKNREGGSFAAWLFTIARRRTVDYYRRQRPYVPLSEAWDRPDEDPLARVVRNEALRRLAALVAQLYEEQQELLRLRFAGGTQRHDANGAHFGLL